MDQDDAGYGYASEDVCDIDSCIGLVRRSVSVHIFQRPRPVTVLAQSRKAIEESLLEGPFAKVREGTPARNSDIL